MLWIYSLEAVPWSRVERMKNIRVANRNSPMQVSSERVLLRGQVRGLKWPTGRHRGPG